MTSSPSLPPSAATVVGIGARIVPAAARHEWRREWNGELGYLRRRGAGPVALTFRALSSLRDALWLRSQQWSVDMLWQDLRFAVRAHRKRPGFAMVALLTLAMGIGATSALFSIVNGVLLEPLRYPDSDQLVRMYGFNTSRGVTRVNMNPNDLTDVRERADTIRDLAWATSDSVTLTELEEPIRLPVDYVRSSYFEVLGATPLAGRFFLENENDPEAERVIVLAESTWRELFGADPATVGRSLLLSGQPHTVVGIAPSGFAGPFHASPVALWMTLPVEPDNRGGHFVRAVARLEPGVSIEAAQAEVATIASWIEAEYEKPGRGLELVSLKESIVGPTRPVLMLLLGAVGFVLLIVCANLAGLLLARASGRRREIAVRVALGASRGRVIRQLLSESLLLALAGGAVGIGLAAAFVGTAGRWIEASIPTAPPVTPDWRVLLFAVATSTLCGVLFGLVPALQALTGHATGLHDGIGAGRRERTTFRAGLVVAEVALSLVLLVGAGLLIRSFGNLMSEETGYDPTGVLSARMSVTGEQVSALGELPGFYERVGDAIEAMPGVESVGWINRLPLGNSYSCDGFHLEGDEPAPAGEWDCAEERVVAGDYFATMGIELLEGRWFDETDGADGPPVVVISRTMADRYLSDREAIGAGFKWGAHDDEPYRRVIGIVEDVKHVSLDAPAMPEVYMPQAQYPYYRTLYLAVRGEGDPLALLPSVRSALAGVQRDIPLFEVATMEERLGASVRTRRVTTTALSVFAGAALLLAAIGLYGVLAYSVAQRTREIGIRIALGAEAGNVTRLVLRRGLLLGALGVGIGAVAWMAVAGLLSALLYGVEPVDATTLAAMAVLLLGVAAIASYLPALRATRVDPVEALRA